jgi:hypothetical protein
MKRLSGEPYGERNRVRRGDEPENRSSLRHARSGGVSDPPLYDTTLFLPQCVQAGSAEEQSRLLWENNGPIDESGHGHWIRNHQAVLLTEAVCSGSTVIKAGRGLT